MRGKACVFWIIKQPSAELMPSLSGLCAVLKGLDLTLRKGTVTALVGHSGAGKSTVAALLSRFYDPQAGGIWLGGQPASAFTRGEWARAVALVSQEPVLFAGAPSA